MPRAGIPATERFVARFILRKWCRDHPPESTASLVRAQQRELAALIARADARATLPIQIKRLPGLEASSTNYSLAMIADHLARTNADMARTIASLSRNEPPAIEVVIANYKPDPGAVPPGALSALESSIRELEQALADPPAIRRATRTHPHPWFGPLDASTWACFPSFHQGLHLKQARLVARGLGLD